MRILVAAFLAFVAAPVLAGDTFRGFSVECSSSAWTNVAPARAQPRRVYVHVLDSNAGGVCVGATTASGTACADAATGIELSTGTADLVSHEFITRASLNCRTRAGVATQRLKGFEVYDAQ